MAIAMQVMLDVKTQNTLEVCCGHAAKVSLLRCSIPGVSFEDRRAFLNSNCYLPISVGGKAHEDKRFLATIKLLNKSFKSCHILVADTLHRHTFRISQQDKDLVTLYNISKQEGDNWLVRNKFAYEQLTIPYEIIRWDECLQHKLFTEKLNIINNLYDTDQDCRDAFNINVEQYLSRYKNRNKNANIFNYDVAYASCVEYLKEECAVVYLLIEKQYNFELYPSQRGTALERVYEKLISPFYSDLLKAITFRFRFRTKKQRCNNVHVNY